MGEPVARMSVEMQWVGCEDVQGSTPLKKGAIA